MQTGVITAAPPIVSRVFQDLSMGVVTVNNAKKISDTPFPFPYCQSLQMVLLVHAVITPFVFVQWIPNPLMAGAFTFLSVALFQTLNFISAEIEHPFGVDPNDLDRERLQAKFNTTLVTMLSPSASRRPFLRDQEHEANLRPMLFKLPELLRKCESYSEAWNRVGHTEKMTHNISELHSLAALFDSFKEESDHQANVSHGALQANPQNGASIAESQPRGKREDRLDMDGQRLQNHIASGVNQATGPDLEKIGENRTLARETPHTRQPNDAQDL